MQLLPCQYSTGRLPIEEIMWHNRQDFGLITLGSLFMSTSRLGGYVMHSKRNEMNGIGFTVLLDHNEIFLITIWPHYSCTLHKCGLETKTNAS